MLISKIINKISLNNILAMEEIYWECFPKRMDDQYYHILLQNGIAVTVKRIDSTDGPYPTSEFNEYYTRQRIYKDYKDLCRIINDEKRAAEILGAVYGTTFFWWNPTVRTIWF